MRHITKNSLSKVLLALGKMGGEGVAGEGGGVPTALKLPSKKKLTKIISNGGYLVRKFTS